MENYIIGRDVKNSTVMSIIGSTKFYDNMKNEALYYSSKGLTTLMTFVDKLNCDEYNIDEKTLMIEGYKRISLSDIAMVVNNQGYIGDNTMREIHYAQFVKEIPVLYNENLVTEKALKGLNIYYLNNNGKYYLINESNISGSSSGYGRIDATKYIRELYIRENLKMVPEINLISDYNLIKDNFSDAIRFANIYRKFMRNGMDITIRFLKDEEFEENIRNSNIYVG